MSYEKQGRIFNIKAIVYNIAIGIALGVFITVYFTGA